MQEDLKFVVIVGSLRRGSFNAAIADTLPELVSEKVIVERMASLDTFPHYSADIEEEGIPQAVAGMADAIISADGVIIITPEYNHSMPGVLKNALDWLSRVSPQPLANKPVLVQSSSVGKFGGVRAQAHLRQVLGYFDVRLLNKPEAIIGEISEKVTKGILTDESTRQFLIRQLVAFEKFVRAAP